MGKHGVLDLRCPDDYPPLCTTLKSEYIYHQWGEVADTNVFLAESGASIRGIVTDASSLVTKDLVSKLPNLEIVASFSVGVDKVDLQFCQQRGVVVTKTPNVLTDAVADTAMALVLTTMRRICEADGFVRGGWQSQPYPLTTQELWATSKKEEKRAGGQTLRVTFSLPLLDTDGDQPSGETLLWWNTGDGRDDPAIQPELESSTAVVLAFDGRVLNRLPAKFGLGPVAPSAFGCWNLSCFVDRHNFSPGTLVIHWSGDNPCSLQIL